MGNSRQAGDADVRKDLKLSGFVMFHESSSEMEGSVASLPESLRENSADVMHITGEKITMEQIKNCAQFIDKKQIVNERVLITCKSGRASSAATAIYYLMHRSGNIVGKDEAILKLQGCKGDIFTKGQLLRQF